jgi:glycosyltransferase involved in cell wall biosynthesis
MAGTVGVVIPTYNPASLVTEAVNSLLSQTQIPDQIVVVDDGSTDNTWEVLKQYGSPVIAVRQTNRGRSEARNTGIARCTTDFICFLDSDDLLTPDSIEVRARWLDEHPDDDGVYGTTRCVDMKGVPQPRPEPRRWPPADLFALLVRYNTTAIHISSIMLRRSLLPEPPYFKPDYDVLEDWDFLLRVTASRPRLHWLGHPVSVYRQHEGMTLPASLPMSAAQVRIQDSIFDMAAFRTLTAAQQARAMCSHALSRLFSGKGVDAHRPLRRSMKVAPWYLPAYLIWIYSWLVRSPIRSSAR